MPRGGSSITVVIDEVAVRLADRSGGALLAQGSAMARFEGRGPAALTLSVRRGSRPRLRPGDLVFDCAGSWKAYRRGREDLLALHSRGSRAPYEVVAVDFAARRGSIHVASPDPRACPFEYPLGEIVFARLLAGRAGVIVHACGAVLAGRGILCAGRSGAGKSTLASLLARHAAAPIVSDDRVAVRVGRAGARISGSPWSGTGGFALPCSAPLSGVFFLRHAARTRALRLSEAEAAARLLALTVIPYWHQASARRAIATCAALAARVPAYDLGFAPDERAVERLAGLTALS